MKKIICILLIFSLFLLLISCGSKDKASVDAPENSPSVDTSFSENSDDMFTDRDKDTSPVEDGCIKIELIGDSANCESDSVRINGTTVIISGGATYLLTGTLTEGKIVVAASDADKPTLILDGVSITNSSECALYVKSCDKVFLNLKENTANYIGSNGTLTPIEDENTDGAVYSKSDLTISGLGTLEVVSVSGHGIVCNDDLVITGGQLNVSAASHAIDANDSVRLTAASLTLKAGKDGIHAENSLDTALGFVFIENGNLNINAEGDGISASSYMNIKDGSFNIVSGGGRTSASSSGSDGYGSFPGGGMGGMFGSSDTSSNDTDSTSTKGIKSEATLLIEGGSFALDCADDALHSNLSVSIKGGEFTIATADDGIHANDTLEISGGNINVTESYEGLEALNIAISGGNIKIVADDDGINASGGNDGSGFGGMHGGDMFGGGGPGGGGPGGRPRTATGGTSSGSINISGGTIYINASGDGIDANGSLAISGGHTTVCGPTSGDTAVLDYDNRASITGGTFIGTGSYMMAQSFSESGQGVIAVSVGNQSAGTKITLTDSDGNTVFDLEPILPFAIVILSSPDMIKGEEYTITVGSASGTFTAQ